MQSIANLFISDLTHHGGHLAWNDLLLHLLGQGILQRQVVAAVDEQLVLKTEICLIFNLLPFTGGPILEFKKLHNLKCARFSSSESVSQLYRVSQKTVPIFERP